MVSFAELSALRKTLAEPAAPIAQQKLICIHALSRRDMAYESFYRKFLPSNVIHHFMQGDLMWSEIAAVAQKLKAKGKVVVLTSSTNLLTKLLQLNNIYISESRKVAVSLQDWAGAFFSQSEHKLPEGISEVLIVNELAQLVTVPHAPFVLQRHLCKLFNPKIFIPATRFTWRLLDSHQLVNEFLDDVCANGKLMACDIETSKSGHSIKCIGFSLLRNDGSLTNVVIPFNQHIGAIRLILESDVQKIFQNGKYDNLYLLRWNIITANWGYDTYHMNHALFSEMPRSLGELSSFYLREHIYWKDESEGGLKELYEYCAKDVHRTMFVWLNQLKLIASNKAMYGYAIDNYALEFRILFPALQCEAEGIECDDSRRLELLGRLKQQQEELLNKLQARIKPHFNPNSPKQVKTLFQLIVGEANVEKAGTDAKGFDVLRTLHPLAAMFCDDIQQYRELTKLVGTYVDIGEDGKDKLLNGRVYYSLDPAGTDSSRLASRESSFWCGLQIQNMPREPDMVKSFLKADDGFMLMENDAEQAEARCVAYLSDCPSYIHAVEETPDFHLWNCSLFFGIPFEELWLDGKGKKINGALRDLGKRVNHGSNYNMGAKVLLSTMGIRNVLRAKELLKLPKAMTPLKVCEFLLKRFVDTYPEIKQRWYEELKIEISKTRKLSLPPTVEGIGGWTRRCFSNPEKSKQALNMYVAHKPQAISVQIINTGFYRCWKELQSKDYRLKAQIHDSIFAQASVETWDHYNQRTVELMSQKIKMPSGKTLFVPIDKCKKPGLYWGDMK